MRFICNKIIIKLLLLFILLIGRVEAQTLDSVRVVYKENDLPRVKQLIDEFVVDSPAIAAGWLLKAKIYRALNDNIRYRDLTADANGEVFIALKKVYFLQPDLLKGDSTALYIYKSYTDNGVAFFNAGTEKQNKADYEQALVSFKKAANVREVFNDLGFWPSGPDTTNLYYSAKSAIYAEKEEESVFFSKKIANLGLNEPKFETIFQWLLYYFRQKGDETSLDQYSVITEKAYPTSDYYLLNYIDWYRSLGNATSLVKTYQKLFNGGFTKQEYRLSYLKDLYQFAFMDAAPSKASFQDETEQNKLKELLYKELTSFVKKNPRSVEGKLLFGKFYINQAVDFQNRKGNISASLILSNKYLQEVADRSPKAETCFQIEATQLLIANFTALKMPDKVRRYKAKLKQLSLIGLIIGKIIICLIYYLT
ncbi:hypothetical protein LK994_12315 [Ferruginibacter lapsinanis]|uniref:hypothetical protein n=1 Tax=Ferruginibacter lapsinanis TaxID=563172 RepID=UPI001E4E1F85|nr:hypothetical protein [Ferruginibacter lapsinanis]UEG49416.1 hypothetical protein LK994_12315 [Ferruginibacter lapsinanis]